LEKYSFSTGVEIHSISDVPGNTGLGSSGAFLVCLLTVLNSIEKKEMSRFEVADTACRIEMVELNRSCGKQDQFASAYGGIITLKIDQTGGVVVSNLPVDREVRKQMERNILIYHSNFIREAEPLLRDQNDKLKRDDPVTVSCVRRIKEIGLESQDFLLSGRLDDFGRLLDEHWRVKRQIGEYMTNPEIDRLYDEAMRSGALGGKVMGAGGGGFFMFYVPPEKQNSFRSRMKELSFLELDWCFNYAGCEMIFAN
jgi:D-glycero-alpha-D-manno-heptose-7-phosphate kinase